MPKSRRTGARAAATLGPPRMLTKRKLCAPLEEFAPDPAQCDPGRRPERRFRGWRATLLVHPPAMSSLRAPGLGPIVGHTTDRSCRLWIQAPLAEVDEEPPRRTAAPSACWSVIARAGAPLRARERPCSTSGFVASSTAPAPSSSARSRSLGGRGEPYRLAPDTKYRVRVGLARARRRLDNDAGVASDALADRLPPPHVGPRASTASRPTPARPAFRTHPAAGAVADAGLPARLLPLSGPALEDQGGRPHLRPDDEPSGGRRRQPAARQLHADGRRSDLWRRTESQYSPPARRYLCRVPEALCRGVRGDEHAPPAEHGADLHDPRRPRDRGQLVAGSASSNRPRARICSMSRSPPT